MLKSLRLGRKLDTVSRKKRQRENLVKSWKK